MKALRGTELAVPFHLLYTPWGLSPGGMDQKMAHQFRGECHYSYSRWVLQRIDTNLL